MLNFIIGVIIIGGIILLAGELFSDGAKAAGNGSGCGCVVGIIMMLFAIGLFTTIGSAPLGMIIVAIAAILLKSVN